MTIAETVLRTPPFSIKIKPRYTPCNTTSVACSKRRKNVALKKQPDAPLKRRRGVAHRKMERVMKTNKVLASVLGFLMVLVIAAGSVQAPAYAASDVADGNSPTTDAPAGGNDPAGGNNPAGGNDPAGGNVPVGNSAAVTVETNVGLAIQFRDTEGKADNTFVYPTGDESGYLFASGNADSADGVGTTNGTVSGLPDGGSIYIAIEPQLGSTLKYSSIKINGVDKTFQSGTEPNVYKVDVADTYTIEVAGSEARTFTIMWTNSDAINVEGTDFAKEDCIIGNGKAYVRAVYDNKDDMNNIFNTINDHGSGCVDSEGKGYVVLEEGNVVDFAFIPDYGYQLTSVAANGFPLEAQGSQNEFRFIMPNNHIHFNATFTPTNDVVAASAASVSEGSLALAEGELAGGTARLDVRDVAIDNKGEFEAAAEGYVVSEYLDISLHNVFYKGKNDAEDVWSTPVEDLDKPAEITLKLQNAIDTDEVKIVHEKEVAPGQFEYELLDAEYDPETLEVTFSTSSFSNYAIAYVENPPAEGENDADLDEEGDGKGKVVIAQTGDENPAAGLMVLAAAASVVAAAALIARRKLA